MSSDSNSPFDFDRALKEMAHSYAAAKWPANNTKPVVSQGENNMNLDTVKWDGEGLPPIGAVCEGYVGDLHSNYTWHKVEVLKNTGEECAVYLSNKGLLRWCDDFRPIRTPEEVNKHAEWDELFDLIKDFVPTGAAGASALADAIQEAGYRKQGDKS